MSRLRDYRRDRLAALICAARHDAKTGTVSGDSELRMMVRTMVADLTPEQVIRVAAKLLKEYCAVQ